MNYSKRTAFLLALMLFAANFSFAQTAPSRQEKLLNGLKVLIWNEPKAEKVSLRLRIHSGAAFDPKDKMGTMAMLADILFPEEQTRRFFEEDLEGSLEITSNYDYIQINATGKADDFLTILETIATAVSNPPITPENFIKVRDARLKTIEETQKNPAYIADMAVAKRLLGDFPYGRPQTGTTESVKLIERADLLTAKDKFFTADNATLTITGSVKPDFAYMAARRLFGAWKKADRLIPATFRQPDEPPANNLLIEIPNVSGTYQRVAYTTAARNDKDYYATYFASDLIFCRAEAYDAHLLRGIFVIALDSKDFKLADKNQPQQKNCSVRYSMSGQKYVLPPIKQDELDAAKAKLLSEITANPVKLWLDVDTFKLVSVKDEIQRLNSVTSADVLRVTESFLKAPSASILVKAPAEK